MRNVELSKGSQKMPSSQQSNTKPSNQKAPEQKHLSKDFKDSFIQKIQVCSMTLDFTDDTKQKKEKSERLQYFQDLQDLMHEQSVMQSLIVPNIKIIMEMIEKNIFRPLPVLKKAVPPAENGVEEIEVLVDPSWPHLQPVYEFFLQLIVNDAADVKTLKVFITLSFVQEFLEIIDSEEPKEREYLKNILHRLYAKLVPRRKMIRKAITDCFQTLIHENFKFNGSAELLDILASIISGFAVPLRDEHIIFFKQVIIPLHKVQTCHIYHEQLLRCSMLFLSKDSQLAITLVDGLLKYWPFGNSIKEVLYLSELLEVLEVCDIIKLEPLIPRLFKRLIRCISGCHLQVADRSMCFFENDFFLTILKHYRLITFMMLVPVIVQIADTHWHKVLQESLNALKTILKEIDPVTYENALKNQNNKNLALLQDNTQPKKERQEIDEKWKVFTKQAQAKNASIKEVIVPYCETYIVGKHNGLNNGHIYFT